MSRILAAALLLAAALPAGAQIKWGDQFDEITCGQWEPLDMTGRIEKLKAIEPFGSDLEQADRGAAGSGRPRWPPPARAIPTACCATRRPRRSARPERA